MTAMEEAVRIDTFGSREVMKFRKLPVPTPGPNEILLKVKAASINPVDWKIREGLYPAVKSDKLPYVLGRDVSGVAEACGTETTGHQMGDQIYAMLGFDRGAYAEHVIVKGNEAAPKPRSIDYLAAAGVPLAGLTAWQGLFRHGELKAGQRVLIHGGSGGVGHFAVQFAKAKGAHVITTVSEKHIEFVREIGADEVVDYKRQKFEDMVREVDVVFDLIGGETRERSWPVLKKGGILVSTMMEPFNEKPRELGMRAERYTVQENGEELREIGSLIDAGKVKPKISKVFDFHEVGSAFEYIEKGDTEGKVVLKVAG
jgi:NADPH:quinone reductase-like Zn-dependent oxidoreductase